MSDHPREHPDDVVGFNSEVSFRGATYHVQTENIGDLAEPTINTLIFLKGTLVHKVSSAGPDTTGNVPLLERIRRQHTAALNRIKRGEFHDSR